MRWYLQGTNKSGQDVKKQKKTKDIKALADDKYPNVKVYSM